MRRLVRVIEASLGALACGFAVWFVLQKAFPFRLRVGMPWKEAQRVLSWTAHRNMDRCMQARVGFPIDEETGKPLWFATLHHVGLPDRTYARIYLRAPNDEHLGLEGYETAEYSIDGFEVGPRFRGYPGKLEWGECPKAYPDVVDLSWWSWPALGGFVAGAVLGALGVAHLQRLRGWAQEAMLSGDSEHGVGA